MSEQYGKSPCVEALEDIKRYNETEESIRVAASAAFVEERLTGEIA